MKWKNGKIACYNKIPYATKDKAENFALHQKEKFGHISYVYYCRYCKLYHLTTKIPKQ